MPAFEPVVLTAGPGLTLSPFTSADAGPLTSAVDDAELRRWLPLPRPYTVDVARAWCTDTTRELRDSGSGLVLAVRRDDRLAGSVDVKRVDWRARTAELGYWTAAAHRGEGIMPRAVTALSGWLFDALAFERIELRIATGNLASRRVAEKAGFRFEGVARNAGFTDDGRVDLAVHALIRSDRPSG